MKSAFLVGFRRRHPLIIIGAFVFVACQLLALEWWLRAGGLAQLPVAHLLRDSFDQNTLLSHRVATQKRQPSSFGDYRVLLFGGSSLRECLEDATALRNRLNEVVARKVNVLAMASSQQTFGEVMSILDNVPGGPGLAVIALNPSRFSRAPGEYLEQLEGERLLLTGPTLREFMKIHFSPSWHWYSVLPSFFRLSKLWVKENWGTLRRAQLPSHRFQPHFYKEQTKLSLEEKNEFFEKYVLGRMVPRFEKHMDFNFLALEEVIRLARKKQWDVAFLEMPYPPLVRKPLEKVFSAYAERVNRLVAKYQIPYWDDAKDLSLENEDFGDVFHLVERGRERYDLLFSEKLGQYLGGGSGTVF